MFKSSIKRSYQDNRIKKIIEIPKKDYFDDMMKTVEFKPSPCPQPLSRIKIGQPMSKMMLMESLKSAQKSGSRKSTLSPKKGSKTLIVEPLKAENPPELEINKSSVLRIRDSVDEVLPLTSPERQIKGRQLMDKFLTTDKKNGQSVNKLGISPENYKNIKPHPQTASPFKSTGYHILEEDPQSNASTVQKLFVPQSSLRNSQNPQNLKNQFENVFKQPKFNENHSNLTNLDNSPAGSENPKLKSPSAKSGSQRSKYQSRSTSPSRRLTHRILLTTKSDVASQTPHLVNNSLMGQLDASTKQISALKSQMRSLEQETTEKGKSIKKLREQVLNLNAIKMRLEKDVETQKDRNSEMKHQVQQNGKLNQLKEAEQLGTELKVNKLKARNLELERTIGGLKEELAKAKEGAGRAKAGPAPPSTSFAEKSARYSNGVGDLTFREKEQHDRFVKTSAVLVSSLDAIYSELENVFKKNRLFEGKISAKKSNEKLKLIAKRLRSKKTEPIPRRLETEFNDENLKILKNINLLKSELKGFDSFDEASFRPETIHSGSPQMDAERLKAKTGQQSERHWYIEKNNSSRLKERSRSKDRASTHRSRSPQLITPSERHLTSFGAHDEDRAKSEIRANSEEFNHLLQSHHTLKKDFDTINQQNVSLSKKVEEKDKEIRNLKNLIDALRQKPQMKAPGTANTSQNTSVLLTSKIKEGSSPLVLSSTSANNKPPTNQQLISTTSVVTAGPATPVHLSNTSAAPNPGPTPTSTTTTNYHHHFHYNQPPGAPTAGTTAAHLHQTPGKEIKRTTPIRRRKVGDEVSHSALKTRSKRSSLNISQQKVSGNKAGGTNSVNTSQLPPQAPRYGAKVVIKATNPPTPYNQAKPGSRVTRGASLSSQKRATMGSTSTVIRREGRPKSRNTLKEYSRSPIQRRIGTGVGLPGTRTRSPNVLVRGTKQKTGGFVPSKTTGVVTKEPIKITSSVATSSITPQIINSSNVKMGERRVTAGAGMGGFSYYQPGKSTTRYKSPT